MILRLPAYDCGNNCLLYFLLHCSPNSLYGQIEKFASRLKTPADGSLAGVKQILK
jgi:hypothetical protein